MINTEADVDDELLNCEKCIYWDNEMDECRAFTCDGHECPILPCETE